MPRESARLSRRRRRERRGQRGETAVAQAGQQPTQAPPATQQTAAVKPRPRPLPPRRASRRPFRLTPKLYRRLFYVFSIFVVVGMVVGLIAVNAGPTSQPVTTARTGPGLPVDIIPSPSIADPEAEGLSYNSSPPTSGPHTDEPAPWGVHTEPIPKPVQVENLRRGGILVQYSSGATPEMVAQLEEIVGGYSDLVALAPYPDMASAIALTAWGRIAFLDQVDQGSIESFIQAYRGLGQGFQ